MKLLLKNIALILLTISIFTLAWPPNMFGPLIFVTFVPVFFVIDTFKKFKKPLRYFITLLTFICVVFGCVYSTAHNAWGAYNSNIVMAAMMAIIPLSIIISFYSLSSNRTIGLIYFVFSWGIAELLMMTWELNSPLYLLGNSLSLFPSLIQHYSIWGVVGGGIFILIVNALIYSFIIKFREKEKNTLLTIFSVLACIPIVLSIMSFSSNVETTDTVTVGMTFLQKEHFTKKNSLDSTPLVQQYNKILAKADTTDVDLFVFPESALVNGGWVEGYSIDEYPKLSDALCPGKEVIFGSHMFSTFQKNANETPYYVRFDANSNTYYQTHNCILFRNNLGNYFVRSKDKFVSFHEIIPYPSIFMFTKSWFNKDENPDFLSILKNSYNEPFSTSKGVNIYGIMCFESFFSDKIIQQKEADFIVILANESWNYQKKGKDQYFSYMVTKAIESGKTVVKVSNCGISGVINSKGKVLSKEYNLKPHFTKTLVPYNNDPSFYCMFASDQNKIIITITLILFICILFEKFNPFKINKIS